MADDIRAQQPNRRSLLAWAIFGIGAIFLAIIGVPIVCYIIDPRNRKGPKSAMRLVEGVKLDDLVINTPVQGLVRDTRMDGWTLYPNDVLGRVWVVQRGARPANVANLTEEQKDAYLMVFTTICPHLGCSVNTGGPGFACPCHNATFTLTGARAAAGNPAQRGMDTLAWEIDPEDPEHNRIKVTYKKYKANDAQKIPLGGGEEEKANT
jgi:menaquinol-cytochrome c reductase iron-sulfur subunit